MKCFIYIKDAMKEMFARGLVTKWIPMVGSNNNSNSRAVRSIIIIGKKARRNRAMKMWQRFPNRNSYSSTLLLSILSG